MRALLSLCLSLPFLAVPAFGWGCEGHQMVALIARAHLKPQVAAAIDELLTQNPIDPELKRFCQERPADTMADAATWADDVKNIEKTGGWHYIDIPLTVTEPVSLDSWCPPVGPSTDGKDRPGCIVNAFALEEAILRDKARTGAERATALRYLIHFAGDIHQPLHDSDNNDRGGNCTSLQFFTEDKPVNLHAIWDYKLIEHDLAAKKQSQAEYAHSLDAKYAARSEAGGNPTDWAWEGHRLAQTVTYRSLSPGIPVETPDPKATCDDERAKVTALHISIGDKYFTETIPAIDEQIARAGYRLAALLNRIL